MSITEESAVEKNIYQRMIRATKLEDAVYEEVENDRSATGQAVGVIVISSLAAGIGAVTHGGLGGIIAALIGALIGWAVWIALIYAIGVKLLPEPNTRSDPAELLRTTGFAASPGVLRIAGIIPGLGPLLVLAASIWMLVAMVVAVRQALDYESTGRAVGVCLLGWLAQIIIFAGLMALTGAGPEAV